MNQYLEALDEAEYAEDEDVPQGGVEQADGTIVMQFHISGRYVTYLARRAWCEGRADRAFHLLAQVQGLTMNQGLDILEGRLTLYGWSSSDAGVRVRADQAAMPVLAEVVEIANAAAERPGPADEDDDDLDEEPGPLRGLGGGLASPFDDARMHIAARIADPGMRERLMRATLGMEAVERGEVKLQRDPEFASDTGWLSPTGVFWRCQVWQHVATAQLLVSEVDAEGERDPEEALERLGWAKVTAGRWRSGKPLTQAQRTALWDWCERHGEVEDYDDLVSAMGDDEL